MENIRVSSVDGVSCARCVAVWILLTSLLPDSPIKHLLRIVSLLLGGRRKGISAIKVY